MGAANPPTGAKARLRGIPAWPWALLGAVTIPLLLTGWALWWAERGHMLFADVNWYARGLDGLLADGPLYDPAKLLPHAQLERPPFWDQAPSTALLTPLLAPADGALWGMVMAGSTLVGLRLTWPRVGYGGTLLLAPVVLLWAPVVGALFWGNVNGLVFCLLAVAWRFPRLAGTAIGVAAAVKLVPILGVAWLAGRRDWKGAAIGLSIPVIATLVVVVLKGPETIADFIQLRLNQWAPDVPGSQRWSISEVFGVPNWVGYGIGIVLAALSWRRASFSIAILAMLAATPSLQIHYWTWLLVPFLGIWMPWLLQRRQDGVGHGSRQHGAFGAAQHR